VSRRSVHARHFPAHGADIGAELAAVVDEVEEEAPGGVFDRGGVEDLTIHVVLRLASPLRVVEGGHGAVHRLGGAVAGGNHVVDGGGGIAGLPFHLARIEGFGEDA